MDWIRINFLQNKDLIEPVLYSFVLLIVLFGLRAYMGRIVSKKISDRARQFTMKKAIRFILVLMFLIALLVIWQDSSGYIVSVIGFFTAGLAFAMRDIILNMIGYFYILWGSPFKVGDRIEVSDQIGDVIDIRLLQFSILEVGNRVNGEQSTGRIVHIPNIVVFTSPLSNFEKGFRFIWNELQVTIDKESDWELAKELIYALLEEKTKNVTEEAKSQIDKAGKEYLIFYSNLTPTIYTTLKDSNIVLTARYLCEPRKVRTTEHILWEAILKMFKQHEEIKLI